MNVLICGGRDYNNWLFLSEYLDYRFPAEHRQLLTIIAGGARGADKLAEKWANARGITTKIYKADWQKYGRAAGQIRNKQMLVEGQPVLVIAFPGGAGTMNMIGQARKAGVDVEIVDEMERNND